MASHDIDKVVRLDAFMNAVPPTPTTQTWSDSKPIHHLVMRDGRARQLPELARTLRQLLRGPVRAVNQSRLHVQVIGLFYIFAQQLLARRGFQFCRDLIELFEVVADVVGMGKIRRPEEAILAAQLNHRGQ